MSEPSHVLFQDRPMEIFNVNTTVRRPYRVYLGPFLFLGFINENVNTDILAPQFWCDRFGAWHFCANKKILKLMLSWDIPHSQQENAIKTLILFLFRTKIKSCQYKNVICLIQLPSNTITVGLMCGLKFRNSYNIIKLWTAFWDPEPTVSSTYRMLLQRQIRIRNCWLIDAHSSLNYKPYKCEPHF